MIGPFHLDTQAASVLDRASFAGLLVRFVLPRRQWNSEVSLGILNVLVRH
jgi:hypothetical protein